MARTRTIIESPYAGNIERNMEYLRRAMRHSLAMNEAPFASHAMYTQALRDHVPVERKLGMHAGQAWYAAAERVVVYTDYGVTSGMEHGINHAMELGIEIQYRTIGGND